MRNVVFNIGAGSGISVWGGGMGGYLVRSISDAYRSSKMPTLEYMLLERDERSLQTVPVDVPKRCGLGDLITKMFLCEDGLVVLCEPGNITASSPPHIFE